jgi:uncharacterized repeat protein (TIGR02543 family)
MLPRIIVYFLLVQIVLIPLSVHSATTQLPSTGQAKCWNTTGAEISCAGTGQDGDKKSGVPVPSPRFTDNNNGSVTDNLTGLIWLKNPNCADVVGGISRANMEWGGALTWSNNMAHSYCGLTDGSKAGDWRLPNVKELRSLVDYNSTYLTAGHPFADQYNTKPYTDETYWTSTTHAWQGASTVIVMDLSGGTGRLMNKRGLQRVWPVRDALPPNIVVSPVSKDFASIATGTTSTGQTFTISNTGEQNLTVSSITLAGGESGMFAADKGNGASGTCGATPTITSAGSCTISTTFSPISSGNKTTTLRITSNDPVTANKDVLLSGTGITYTYTVTYNGNTNTGGSVPTDGISYENGAPVTVLGNTGALTKTGYAFTAWNTLANGSGASQATASTFNMGSANVTLYAQWKMYADINHDEHVNLADAILALQVLAGIAPQQTVYKEADVNNDGKIGLQEVIYILQKVADTR